MTKSMKPICSYCGANYSKKRLQAGYDTCLNCEVELLKREGGYIMGEMKRLYMALDLENGWTCISCGDEHLEDTTGKEVANYDEGTLCLKCEQEKNYE